jgi:hypothetical protein
LKGRIKYYAILKKRLNKKSIACLENIYLLCSDFSLGFNALRLFVKKKKKKNRILEVP